MATNRSESRPSLDRLAALAKERFTPREAALHEAASPPLENLRELWAEGWLGATIDTAYGGLGSRLDTADPATYLQAIRTVARVSPGTAHCLQVHLHASWILQALGTPRQQDRWFSDLRERFLLYAFVGSELGQAGPRAIRRTIARPVEGGWRVSGRKSYATNAPYGPIIVFTHIEGSNDPVRGQLMLVISPDSPGVHTDPDWYRPSGMRIASSPTLDLEDVFVSHDSVLGDAGSYLTGRWQGKYHLGFAANYLGISEGLFRWAVDYLQSKPGALDDPFIQLRIGECRVELLSAQAAFDQAIQAWPTGELVDAELTSMAAKIRCARTALGVGEVVSRIAGSSAQFDHLPLGRMLRDLQTHVQHVGQDRACQTLGRAALGLPFDSTIQR